jgi:hypothetical protein
MAGTFLILLPRLLVNSVSRLGETMADNRASTIVEKEKILNTLRRVYLMKITLAKTKQSSRINSLKNFAIAKIPTRLYNLTISQYPTVGQRLKPLKFENQASKPMFLKSLDLETPIWSGVAS